MIHPSRPLRIVLLLAVVVALAFATGCSRKDKVTDARLSGEVGWNNTIFGLMRDRTTLTATVGCMSCHNGSATTFVDYTEWQNVVSDSNNIQARILSGGNMRRYLLTGEPEVILDWIANGAPK